MPKPVVEPIAAKTLLTEAELCAAADRLRPTLERTPVVLSPVLSQQTGATVHLKLETVQPTHSFKVRGALNALLALDPRQRRKGVVAASQGNHGLGVAWAAARLGVPATIHLPTDTPAARVAALREAGAVVVLEGANWDEANALAIEAAARAGQSYVHPFDDRQVMAGAGVVFLELLEQLPRIDVVVASVGGGGLVSGLISAVRRRSPRTRVVGVETEGADCMSRSLKAGAIVTLPAITSIARSLGARRTEPSQFEIVSCYAEDVVVVSDEAAERQVWETWRVERLLVEPAAACVLAALASGRVRLDPGEHAVAVVCGANVELDEVLGWCQPATAPVSHQLAG